MHTIRLFQKNVYQKNCQAVVSQITRRDGNWLLVTDQTVFFPTGGGQSCDTGFINSIPVSDVREKDGLVYHRLELQADHCPFSAGDTVSMEINWEHRFDNMQRHCGEHILSGVFHTLCGGMNRGFHMGKDFMTIDIALPNDAADTISWETAKEAEMLANEAIWKNLPITVRTFARRADAEKLPLRKALAFDEDISIVTIGDETDPVDCVACCGTHPSGTGQVGLIKIYKVEKNKGMSRIYFEAGRRAFCQYQRQFAVLTELGNQLSAGTDDILQKFHAQQEKNIMLRDQLYHLKKKFISDELASIRQNLHPLELRIYRELSLDDLSEIGKQLLDETDKLLLLVHEPTHTALLFSKRCDCGKLVREHLPVCGGKGGGGKPSARAVFPDAEKLQQFISLLQTQLA